MLPKNKSVFLKILSQGDEPLKSVKKKLSGGQDDAITWGTSDVTCVLYVTRRAFFFFKLVFISCFC
jgi:hypothetical protein